MFKKFSLLFLSLTTFASASFEGLPNEVFVNHIIPFCDAESAWKLTSISKHYRAMRDFPSVIKHIKANLLSKPERLLVTAGLVELQDFFASYRAMRVAENWAKHEQGFVMSSESFEPEVLRKNIAENPIRAMRRIAELPLQPDVEEDISSVYLSSNLELALDESGCISSTSIYKIQPHIIKLIKTAQHVVGLSFHVRGQATEQDWKELLDAVSQGGVCSKIEFDIREAFSNTIFSDMCLNTSQAWRFKVKAFEIYTGLDSVSAKQIFTSFPNLESLELIDVKFNGPASFPALNKLTCIKIYMGGIDLEWLGCFADNLHLFPALKKFNIWNVNLGDGVVPIFKRIKSVKPSLALCWFSDTSISEVGMRKMVDHLSELGYPQKVFLSCARTMDPQFVLDYNDIWHKKNNFFNYEEPRSFERGYPNDYVLL